MDDVGHWVKVWRVFDGMNNDKIHLKVKESRQTRMYLGFIGQEQT